MGVAAVCAYPKILEQVAAGNREVLPPPYWSHFSKRRIYCLVPPVEGLWRPYTHANCVCNEIVSAANRVLGVVPKPTRLGVYLLRKTAKRLSRRLPKVSPWRPREVADSFKGRRRARYALACDSLEVNPLIKRDAAIKAFVKPEKFCPADKVNPDPRMIQARNARYNVEVGCFLKPMEHTLYQLPGPTGLRMIAKGLNQFERAELLVRKMEQFECPVVYSLDGSRWDKHVSREILEIEHMVYLAMCFDPWFKQLLSWQLDNRCFTQGGCKYRVSGGRMSGDMNTALGNCLLMCIMAETFARAIRLPIWDVLDDGDDCLLIFESREEARVRKCLPGWFLQFGQEVKLENRATCVEDVNFCQSKPVLIEGRWRFVRDWRKVLSQDCCGVRNWGDPRLVRDMLTAIGTCNVVLGRGVPILQVYGEACLRNGSGKLPKAFVDEAIALRLGREVRAYGCTSPFDAQALQPLPITGESRLAFERTWGVPPQMQLDIERVLSQWTVDEVLSAYQTENLSAHCWKQDAWPDDPLPP